MTQGRPKLSPDIHYLIAEKILEELLAEKPADAKSSGLYNYMLVNSITRSAFIGQLGKQKFETVSIFYHRVKLSSEKHPGKCLQLSSKHFVNILQFADNFSPKTLVFDLVRFGPKEVPLGQNNAETLENIFGYFRAPLKKDDEFKFNQIERAIREKHFGQIPALDLDRVKVRNCSQESVDVLLHLNAKELVIDDYYYYDVSLKDPKSAECFQVPIPPGTSGSKRFVAEQTEVVKLSIYNDCSVPAGQYSYKAANLNFRRCFAFIQGLLGVCPNLKRLIFVVWNLAAKSCADLAEAINEQIFTALNPNTRTSIEFLFEYTSASKPGSTSIPPPEDLIKSTEIDPKELGDEDEEPDEPTVTQIYSERNCAGTEFRCTFNLNP